MTCGPAVTRPAGGEHAGCLLPTRRLDEGEREGKKGPEYRPGDSGQVASKSGRHTDRIQAGACVSRGQTGRKLGAASWRAAWGDAPTRQAHTHPGGPARDDSSEGAPQGGDEG